MAIIRRQGNALSVFTGSEVLPNGMRMSPVTASSYSDASLAALGLFRAIPFVTPAGMVTVGSPRYEIGGDDLVHEVFDVETDPRFLRMASMAAGSSYIAGLRRKAAQLRADGDIQGSIDLLLKAAGVPT